MASYASSAAGGGTSGTGDRTAAITPAVGDLICVFAGFRGITGTPTASATDDQGGTYTLIESAFWGASGSEAFFLVRDSLAASAVSHTVTVSGVTSTSGNVVPVAIAGMTKTGAAAVLQSDKAENQTGTTPAPAFAAACDTANLTLGCVCDNVNPPGQTPPTGWTERQDVGQSTPNNGMEVVTRDSGFTGTTVTWGAAESGVYCAIIVELDTSGSGGTVYTLDIGHVASVEAPHGVTTVADAPLSIGHPASEEAPYGLTLTGSVPAPLVRPEYTGTPRFVLDATGETILLRGANTILTASDGVSHAAVDNGANAMRLVLNWHVLEPIAPTGSGTDFSTYATSLDSTTLDEIDALCQYFADAGAYVLLDFHQAAWSPYFSGSGVPDWYYTDSRFTAQQNGGAGWLVADKSTAIKSWWTDATESPMSQQLYINFVTAFIEWAQAQPWYDHVFGYTTFNELNAGNMTGSSASKISSMHTWLAPVVAAMNAIEPDRALFVMCRGGAQGWGTATFSEFGDLASQNICAEFHQYYTGLAPGVDADAPVPLTPTYVQEGNVSAHLGSDVTANVNVAWPAATTDGSCLLLVVVQRNSGGGASPIEPTVSGWTSVQSRTFGGTLGRQTIFKIESAASRSGNESIDFTPAGAASHTRYYAAQLLEYADADTVDVVATAAIGSDDTPTTNASGTLAEDGELALAFFGLLDNNNTQPTDPTNGFAIRRSAGTTASGLGCYSTVTERIAPDTTSLDTAVTSFEVDQWVAQLITVTAKAGAAGVGYDSTGDDYYPDSATVHNTTAGSTYTGDEQYQEAFLGVPLAKAASLGIPAFLGEFGVHYDDTGRLDYVADMTVAMDSLGLSGCVWKLGVPPGDSLAICSDSAGTLNDVGSAWSTWWLATDFTPGTDAVTLHIAHIPALAEAFGVTATVTYDVLVGHVASAAAIRGLATPAAAPVSLGHPASVVALHGLDLSATLAQLRLGHARPRTARSTYLGVSNQVLGGQDLHAVEQSIGRKFVALRQNQNITTTTWGGAVGFAQDDGYRVTYRDIQLDDVGSWANVPLGTYDSDLTAIFTNLLADASEFDAVYCAFTHETSIAGDGGAGTQQDYIDAHRYVRLFADAMGASMFSVTGEYLGGPIIWCFVGWDRMFVGLGGVGGPDAGAGMDDYDPNLGTSPAPAGTSYYERIGSDVYNDLSAGVLKYPTDAAVLLQPIYDAAVARGMPWMIGEWGCADGTTTTDHTNKADWIDSFRTFIEGCPTDGPGSIDLVCSTVKISSSNYQPDSSAESLAAWQRLAQSETFLRGIDVVGGITTGVTLALPIGHIAAAAQAFGIGFGAAHDLLIGAIASGEVPHGADLAATLGQLSLGHVPSAAAGHGLAAPVTSALLLGHVSTPSLAHGLLLGAVHQLPIGHAASVGAAHGVGLTGDISLAIGHIPGASAIRGLDLLLLGRPTLFRLVPCYSGSRTMSPFLPHQIVHLAPAHAFDVSLDLDAHVELEQAEYEVDL